jgi:hypothetical protein
MTSQAFALRSLWEDSAIPNQHENMVTTDDIVSIHCREVRLGRRSSDVTAHPGLVLYASRLSMVPRPSLARWQVQPLKLVGRFHQDATVWIARNPIGPYECRRQRNFGPI